MQRQLVMGSKMMEWWLQQPVMCFGMMVGLVVRCIKWLAWVEQTRELQNHAWEVAQRLWRLWTIAPQARVGAPLICHKRHLNPLPILMPELSTSLTKSLFSSSYIYSIRLAFGGFFFFTYCSLWYMQNLKNGKKTRFHVALKKTWRINDCSGLQFFMKLN